MAPGSSTSTARSIRSREHVGVLIHRQDRHPVGGVGRQAVAAVELPHRVGERPAARDDDHPMTAAPASATAAQPASSAPGIPASPPPTLTTSRPSAAGPVTRRALDSWLRQQPCHGRGRSRPRRSPQPVGEADDLEPGTPRGVRGDEVAQTGDDRVIEPRMARAHPCRSPRPRRRHCASAMRPRCPRSRPRPASRGRAQTTRARRSPANSRSGGPAVGCAHGVVLRGEAAAARDGRRRSSANPSAETPAGPSPSGTSRGDRLAPACGARRCRPAPRSPAGPGSVRPAAATWPFTIGMMSVDVVPMSMRMQSGTNRADQPRRGGPVGRRDLERARARLGGRDEPAIDGVDVERAAGERRARARRARSRRLRAWCGTPGRARPSW